MTRDTYNYYQAFGSGDVTTFFNGLGLSRSEFEHPTLRLRDERSYPSAAAELFVLWYNNETTIVKIYEKSVYY